MATAEEAETPKSSDGSSFSDDTDSTTPSTSVISSGIFQDEFEKMVRQLAESHIRVANLEANVTSLQQENLRQETKHGFHVQKCRSMGIDTGFCYIFAPANQCRFQGWPDKLALVSHISSTADNEEDSIIEFIETLESFGDYYQCELENSFMKNLRMCRSVHPDKLTICLRPKPKTSPHLNPPEMQN
eukprot:Gb_24227 [translate_table: standard]